MKRNLLLFGPAILWLFISTILLCLPGSRFPKEDWLDKIWFDKWVHIFMFAALVILWCRPFFSRRSIILITISFIAYGVAMELVQERLVNNRSFDYGDIIADTIGAVTGFIYSSRVYKKK